MRVIWRCLIICLVILIGIVTNRDKVMPAAEAKGHGIYDQYREWWHHYIQGYYVEVDCQRLTINRQKVNATIRYNRTIIHLNRQTILGEYHCSDSKNQFNFRIGYILCDPSKIAPEKVCPVGHFCVINGSSTDCQKHLDCEGVVMAGECGNGRASSRAACSRYNNASHVPKSYYIALSLSSCGEGPCLVNKGLVRKGNAVEYMSTILVSNSSDLQPDVWNETCRQLRKLYCDIRISKDEQHRINYTRTDFAFVWRKRLPAKINVFCSNRGMGWSQFYILFYEENRAQFSIIQEISNTNVNLTNTTEQEIWLHPSAPFNCTVSIDGGLFIKALSTETSEYIEPRLGSDSIGMEYKDTPNAIYTCTAKVYYYEQFPPDQDRFKLLYKESRVWSVRVSTTRSTTGTQGYTSSVTEQSMPTRSNTTMSAKETERLKVTLIAVCVVFSLVVIGLIIAVIILAVHMHKAKVENKKLTAAAAKPSLYEAMPDEADEEGVNGSTSAAD